MKSQVLFLAKEGIVDTSFIGLDSTPVAANTSQNNPKSFLLNKFKPDNQPKTDSDCKLGVHTASNQADEKKFAFYWGYKNYVLVDCISGLPVYSSKQTQYEKSKTSSSGKSCLRGRSCHVEGW